MTNRTYRTYPDLESAGHQLADALTYSKQTYGIVLAIANAGVPVAIPVAKKLGTPFDLIVIRRLFAANEQRGAISATSVAGHLIFDEGFMPALANPTTPEDHFIHDAISDLSMRVDELRGKTEPKDIARKHVLLIDNGIHTGETLDTAVQALRTLGPDEITVGVPVANSEIKARVETVADRLVCLHWSERFGHVALWYQHFHRPDDSEIRGMFERQYSAAHSRIEVG